MKWLSLLMSIVCTVLSVMPISSEAQSTTSESCCKKEAVSETENNSTNEHSCCQYSVCNPFHNCGCVSFVKLNSVLFSVKIQPLIIKNSIFYCEFIPESGTNECFHPPEM